MTVPKATFLELRVRVLDDCRELLGTISIAHPLLEANLLHVEPVRLRAILFLRQLLIKHVGLVLTRLHAKPCRGRTGETASIPSLLNAALAEGRLTVSRKGEFDTKRQALIQNLETNGVKFSDLETFRHAELAHSLYRTSTQTDSTLAYQQIHEFAHDTFELMIELDKASLAPGEPESKLPSDFHDWMDFGAALWPDLVDDD